MVCVPNVKEWKDKTLREAHSSTYSIHPGGNKMYQDLKATYWWYGIKGEVVEYVALCDMCQSQGRASITCWVVATTMSA
jgi:hypothetical protein